MNANGNLKRNRVLSQVTARNRRAAVQESCAGEVTGSILDIDPLNLSEEQSLAAEQSFQLLRHQMADMVALLDEWLSESRDRSIWIVLRPRELDRYKQLDAYEPQLRLLLNYDSFTDLVSAWKAARQSWEAAPDDFGQLDAWLMLNRLVYMCLGSMHHVTQELMTMPLVRYKKWRIRRLKWLLHKAKLSGLPDAGDGQSDGRRAHHIASTQDAAPDRQPNARQSHG